MPLYVNYPAWIRPEVIPGFPYVRWYGVMYIVAFAIAIVLFRRQAKNGELGETVTDDDIFGFFWWGIVGLILGARIFSALIYDQSGVYRSKPWLIFWPFSENGSWTGFQGMSYHGGFIGGFIGVLLWCIRRRRSVLLWGDALTASIPLGYTFGRLGNFINGELYGRVTARPWGMIFPQAERFSVSLDWVREIVKKTSLPVAPGAVLVNLPRHPSQLYEALFEGVVLWAILWFVCRKLKPFDGFLIGMYLIGYGAFRFVIEYFREPDADIGYRISVSGDARIYLLESARNISTGQLLCFAMIAIGLALELILWMRNRRGQNSAKRAEEPR